MRNKFKTRNKSMFSLGQKSKFMISNSSGILGLIGIVLFSTGMVAFFTWWLGAGITAIYSFGPSGLSIGMALWNSVIYAVSALLGGVVVLSTGVVFMVASYD